MLSITISRFSRLAFLFLIFQVSTITLEAQSAIFPNGTILLSNLYTMYLGTDGKVTCDDDPLKLADSLKSNEARLALLNPHNDKTTVLTPDVVETVTTTASATFIVTYTGFTAEAQTAFQAAVDIWASLITSSQPIRVSVTFSSLGANVLGSAGSSFNVALNGYLYTQPLVDALTNQDNNNGAADITGRFSSDFPFYFGTDGNCPTGKYDFESVVLHELCHGLGFIGSVRQGGTNPNLPCSTDANTLCYGYQGGSIVYPVVFEKFVKDGANSSTSTSLINTSVYPNPSTTLKTLLTSNSVYFQSSTVNAVNKNLGAKLYAPTAYVQGSTYAHFDETTYPPSSGNALMTYAIANGEIEHFPGAIGCALFKDIGWQVTGGCLTVLPVEFISFTAQNKNGNNVLNWLTATETNNAFFEIENSGDGKNFETLGNVKGVGTSNTKHAYTFTDFNPKNNINYYRLKQVDVDGKFTFSKTVTVLNGKAATNFKLQTNLPQTELFIYAPENLNKETAIEIFDLLGRTVFNATFSKNQYNLRVDISNLTAGNYFLRFDNDAAPLRFAKL